MKQSTCCEANCSRNTQKIARFSATRNSFQLLQEPVFGLNLEFACHDESSKYIFNEKKIYNNEMEIEGGLDIL
jgi:hypothetical protein